MKCNSCRKDLTQEMRHSIASNTCPFCGKGILSEDDYMMKNSISKILIRRGVESDDKILDISNDIMQLIKIDRITSAASGKAPMPPESAPEAPVAPILAPEMPRPAGTSPTPESRGNDISANDAIGRAMAVFERDTAYPSEDGDGGGDDEDGTGPSEDDMESAEGVLFSSQRNEKAERLKAELAKARITGQVAGYKSKPIKRLS